MTKKEWFEISKYLVASYGEHLFNSDSMKIWYELLEDLTPERVKRGVLEMCKTKKYPTVAAIREATTEDFWDPNTWATKA